MQTNWRKLNKELALLSEPEVLVVNLQTEVYDPKDEFKYRWDCIAPTLWQPQNG